MQMHFRWIWFGLFDLSFGVHETQMNLYLLICCFDFGIPSFAVIRLD